MAMDGVPEMLTKRLGYAIKMAQHAVRQRMDEVLRAVDLTMPQYAVLCAVEAEPGLSNAKLARAAFVTPQTMQAVLVNLERDGVLRRDPHPAHGRVLSSHLTAKGVLVLARAHVAARIVEDELVTSFGKENVARIATALDKCAEDLRPGSLDARGPAVSDRSLGKKASSVAEPKAAPPLANADSNVTSMPEPKTRKGAKRIAEPGAADSPSPRVRGKR